MDACHPLSSFAHVPISSWISMAASRLIIVFSLAFAAFAALPLTDAWSAAATPLQISTDEPANISALVGVARQDTLSYVGASSFITVQFEAFDLPPGDKVTVKNPDGSVSFTYTGRGPADAGVFSSSMIPGNTAVIQYMALAASSGSFAYKITKFARSFHKQSSIQSICGGADESLPAKCYARSQRLPLAYERAQAVARISVNGGLCTGWLVGSEGHFITNNHCIGTEADAQVAQFEFEVESSSCEEQCRQVSGCGGRRLVATTSTFITTNATRDYTIVKLPASANIKKYGFLQLRGSGAALKESIYIPQHPGGYAKRISSMVGSGADATIQNMNNSADPSHPNRIGYTADTEPGSSGSPVLAKSDNSVVVLHNTGGCTASGGLNYGINVRYIIADLESKGIIIKDLIANGPSPSTTEAPTPAPPPTPAPTPAPTSAPPVAGQCSGISAATCEATFFCTWDELQRSCQRWW